VKLRLKKNSFIKEIIALVNSGYEAETPQLLIPINLAREFGLWPPPTQAIETMFNTAGGPLKVWIIRKAAKVSVITEDISSEEVDIDLVISHLTDEPLISDMLAGTLQIAIEDIAEGYWRFRWEPKEKIRKTLKPFYYS